MKRRQSSAYKLFRALETDDEGRPRIQTRRARRPDSLDASLWQRLEPYQRCSCGTCRECRENERWDRIFQKFEVNERDERGVFQSPLSDL